MAEVQIHRGKFEDALDYLRIMPAVMEIDGVPLHKLVRDRSNAT